MFSLSDYLTGVRYQVIRLSLEPKVKRERKGLLLQVKIVTNSKAEKVETFDSFGRWWNFVVELREQ